MMNLSMSFHLLLLILVLHHPISYCLADLALLDLLVDLVLLDYLHLLLLLPILVMLFYYIQYLKHLLV